MRWWEGERRLRQVVVAPWALSTCCPSSRTQMMAQSASGRACQRYFRHASPKAQGALGRAEIGMSRRHAVMQLIPASHMQSSGNHACISQPLHLPHGPNQISRSAVACNSCAHLPAIGSVHSVLLCLGVGPGQLQVRCPKGLDGRCLVVLHADAIPGCTPDLLQLTAQ